MKCIICGKALPEHKRKYCCNAHAKLGYLSGLSNPKIDTAEDVRELFEYFKRAFDFYKERFGSNDSWKMRIFIQACYLLKHSPNSIARGLHKNHSDVLYHYKKLTFEEKELAKEFIKDTKNYKYQPKKSIYPEGFSYKN